MSDQLYFYNERGYQQQSRVGAAGATTVVPVSPVPMGKTNRFDGDAWSITDPDPGEGGGASTVSTADRELLTTIYRVKTAFAGASQGDLISATRMMDVSGSNATQVGATSWYNETAQTLLAQTPNVVNLEPQNVLGLTDAQLRAAPVPVGDSIATGQPDSGGVVKVGGRASDSRPSWDNGSRVDAWFQRTGALSTVLTAAAAGDMSGTSGLLGIAPVLSSGGSNGFALAVSSILYDGAATYSLRGNTKGLFAQGSVASGTADDGSNPLKMGGKVFSGPPLTQADGARIDAWFSPRGQQVVTFGWTQNAGDDSPNGSQSTLLGSDGAYARMPTYPYMFNSATGNWDRLRGSKTSGLLVNPAGETYSAVTILLAPTSAVSGATGVAFGAQACSSLDVCNNTGTDIQYQRGGAGNWMTIPAGSARLVQGITNANQISVRRKDVSNTSVTVEAEAFQA